MKRIAVMLFGPPGAGKGTQANLLSAKLDIVHFDTGRFLEALVHDPARQKEKIVQKERKNFDGGKLMTPSFVMREVERETRRFASAGWGVVYSGSPRTLSEAEGLLPVLEKLYGKKNVFAFEMSVPSAVSIKRNSARVLCSFCKAPLLTAYYPSKNPKHCPICGGPFYRRSLDKPAVIKVRLVEYAERTKPVFEVLEKRKHPLHRIDGTPAPYKVFEHIYRILQREFL
jgi:adenylate kinase